MRAPEMIPRAREVRVITTAGSLTLIRVEFGAARGLVEFNPLDVLRQPSIHDSSVICSEITHTMANLKDGYNS